MTRGYKGRRFICRMDGHVWKVVGEATLDGRTYLKLRRAWRPLSRRFRYAVARGDGSIQWVIRDADQLAARVRRERGL